MTHETDPAAPADSPSPDRKGGKRGKGRLMLLAVLVALLAVAGRMAWRSHYFEETDNAYLAAHVSPISARIQGTVQKVLVADNQPVRAGDVLMELDPADQQVRVAQIKAEIARTDEQIRQIDEQVKQAAAEARAAQALVGRAQAQHVRHEAEAQRMKALRNAQLRSVSQSELEAALAARDGAAADVQAQQHLSRAAQAKGDSIAASRAVALAQKNVLAAQLADAELQLRYATVTAPVSGRIGRKNAEVGARVQPGQQLLAIVQDDIWVMANYKETQLRELQAGQQARVRVDAFPGREFVGTIDSLAPASGAQFALLPPDNATGNFTKIVQRIPVKVVLAAKDVQAMGGRLAPGMSAVVEVDLRQGVPLAAEAAP